MIERSRTHRTRFLVKFRDVDDRPGAEGLRGELYVDAHEARELDTDEFWERDLVGAEVLLKNGDPVGTIMGVEAGPGQDRLIVDTTHGERLVPVVREIVVEVDPAAGRVVIDPPEGLLD